MKWPEFLRQTAHTNRITLVGPLYGRPHEPDSPSIYIDGGDRFRPRPTKTPHALVSVGDGDSSISPPDELLPANKSFSDLAFALRGLPTAVTQVDMLGFLGGRRDHELLNLGEVHIFLAARPHPTRVNFEDAGRITIVAFVQNRLELEINGLFSLMAFEDTNVEITGQCRYPFKGKLQALSSHGLSNEGSGLIAISGDKPLYIFIC